MTVDQDTAAPVEANAAAGARSRRQRKALAWQGKACENCNVPLRGPFCHLCGQPEKTPIRDLLSLSTDAFDYLFDVDARLYRTLTRLFFAPGRLTESYLRGKRMSFVRPMRIYLVISALLFIVVSSTSDIDVNISDENVNIGGGVEDSVPAKPTQGELPAAAVLALTGRSLDDPPTSKELESAAAGATTSPEAAAAAAVLPPAANEPAPPATTGPAQKKPLNISFFDEKHWDRKEHPLLLSWLPPAGNDWLNDYIAIIKANLELARDDPKRLGHSFLRVLPQSLFVLLPVFALLLKLVMVFKRRMYMEHLMVAVHSHTFIYMGIIVAVGLSKIAEHWPAGWSNPWWFLMGVSIAWIPLNLFLTQKRIYKQRWWGAPISFLVIGTLYLCLVAFTAFGALVMSLVTL